MNWQDTVLKQKKGESITSADLKAQFAEWGLADLWKQMAKREKEAEREEAEIRVTSPHSAREGDALSPSQSKGKTDDY